MFRQSIVLLLGLASLGLYSCGDYSNPQLKEDLEFLMAVPSRSALELRVASKEPRAVDHPGDLPNSESALSVREDALGEKAAYFIFTSVLSAGVNKGVFGFLEVVDFIIHAVPPTVRETERRVWGPWPSDESPNVEARFEITKLAPGVFGLKYQLRDLRLKKEYTAESGWHDCVFGNVSPQGSIRRGTGNLTIDLNACDAIDQTGEHGTASIGFNTNPDADNPDGKTVLSILYDDFLSRDEIEQKGSAAVPLNATYVYREWSDLSGEFNFSAWGDINDDQPALDALERMDILVRWRADGTGRADVRVGEGDLGDVVITLEECWDAEQARVFYEDSHGLNPSEGVSSSCTLPPTPFD